MSQRAPPKPEADLGSAAEPLMPRCSRKRESAKMRRLFSLFRSFDLSLSPSFVGSSSSARCCCCVVVDRCAKASAYTLDTCSPVRLKAMDDLDEEILGIVRSSVGTECMATPLTHSIDIDIDITLALSRSLSLSRVCDITRRLPGRALEVRGMLPPASVLVVVAAAYADTGTNRRYSSDEDDDDDSSSASDSASDSGSDSDSELDLSDEEEPMCVPHAAARVWWPCR